MITKTVHIGTISHHDKSECTVLRASRHEVLNELNNWFFDYLHANKLPIDQLPPLDDWDRSEEDTSMWYTEFPEEGWLVTMRSEFITFK